MDRTVFSQTQCFHFNRNTPPGMRQVITGGGDKDFVTKESPLTQKRQDAFRNKKQQHFKQN